MCMFLFSVFKDSVAYEPRVSLYLDPQIRDWVLFPITLVMVTCRVCCHIHQFSSSLQHQILVGILRHYVVLLLQSTPKKLSRAAIREQCVPFITIFDLPDRVKWQFCTRRALARSLILRTTSALSPIPPPFYMSISNHLSDAFTTGSYLKDGPPKSDAPSTPPNPMSDPAALDGMMSGMKTQMVMMVPQMIIMGWINFFFQGFVLSA